VAGERLRSGLVDQLLSFPELGLRLLKVGLPVDPAESGGPVFNAWGEVVGVLAVKEGSDPAAGAFCYAVTVESVTPLLADAGFQRWGAGRVARAGKFATSRGGDGELQTWLDYSVRPGGERASEDPDKLPLRITHAAQNAMRGEVQCRTLRATLLEADAIATRVQATLAGSPALAALGVELLGFSVLAIKPVPETAKALEAEARERLLREADDAIYARRNNAVEQERKIRENELNTAVAVQAKQREIKETRLAGQIALEEQRRQLVGTEAENRKTRADAEAYAVKATLEPLTALDPKALQVLAARSVDPRLLVAMAFQEIAANATKVGNLNISPELLETLLHRNGG
jgi:hypothetical protein